MKEVSFEPMSLGRILDYTFKIYKDNFLHFIAITAVIMIPVQLLIMLSQNILYMDVFRHDEYSSPSMEFRRFEETAENEAAEPETDVQEEYIYEESRGPSPLIMGLSMVGSIIGIFLAMVGNKLSQGALTHSVSRHYLGEEVTIGQVYRYVVSRLLRLIGAAILVSLIVFAGFLLFVVPGVIFALWYAIVVPVIIAEDCSVTESLTRSKNLVKGNLGKVFVLGLLIWLILTVVQIPFQIVGQLSMLFLTRLNTALGLMLAQSVQLIGQIIATPIAAAAFILLYYDLRIRKEGFDLEMLAQTVQDEQNVFTAQSE